MQFYNLGHYLRKCRINSGLTQKELGLSIGLHGQFVSNWERGDCGPPGHCFQRIIEVLKLDRDELVAVMISDTRIEIEKKVYSARIKTQKAA